MSSAPAPSPSPSPNASLRLTSTAPEKSPSSGPSSSSSSSQKKDSNNVAFAWICSLVTSVLSLSNNGNGTANPSSGTGLKQKTPNTPNASTPLIPPPSPSSASKPTAKKSLLSPPLLPTPNNNNNNNSTPPSSSEVSSAPALDASSANNSNVAAAPTPANSSATPPPSIPPSLTAPIKKKTLILDLDETLVHSTIKPVSNHHLTVDVMLEGVQCTFYVIKRPHVDTFLRQVSEWYDVTVFTASMRQYADPLLDQLDHKRLFFKGRLFRESCLYKDGSFIKDLGLIGQDLATTIIVDNSPVAYSHNRENALPIDNWLGDNPKDEALLNLLPFLDALRFTQDVRSILSLRMA